MIEDYTYTLVKSNIIRVYIYCSTLISSINLATSYYSNKICNRMGAHTMRYQFGIPREILKARAVIRHIVLTLFRPGIGLSSACEQSRDNHDIESHAPAPAVSVTKAAGMRRDSDGNPIYSVFMQLAVRPSVTTGCPAMLIVQ